MFFMALASAFLVRRGTGNWVPVHIPMLMWVNTIVLLASSATLEMARHRLAKGQLSAYKNLWLVTTVLGVFFLIGQVAAWRILVAAGNLPDQQSGQQFLLYFYRTTRASSAWRGRRAALRCPTQFRSGASDTECRDRSHILLLAFHGCPVALPAGSFVSGQVGPPIPTNENKPWHCWRAAQRKIRWFNC